jgi:predicted RecA/RadA family phage recombinase
MSTTAVQQGDRLTFVATTAHAAGDLVHYNGFYGHVQDDIAAGELGMMILDRVWKFANVPSTLAQGAVVAAPATEQATTLPILAWAGATSGLVANATTGWNAIGRVWETGNASMAAIQLFNPRQ